LYGTGFRNAASTSLRIGSTLIPLLYSGRQPQFQGLDQANAELPRLFAGAGEVVVVFTADNKSANAVTLSFR
jgi:uncharacterized protein (TIGR03437 family)